MDLQITGDGVKKNLVKNLISLSVNFFPMLFFLFVDNELYKINILMESSSSFHFLHISFSVSLMLFTVLDIALCS